MSRCMRVGALAAGLLGATVFAGGTSGGVQVTSADGVPVLVGTPYRGECLLEGEHVNGRIAYWELPASFRRSAGEERCRAGAARRTVAAPGGISPTNRSATIRPRARMIASPLDDDCNIRTFDPLGAVTLDQAGPHVFVQYDQQVSFVRVLSTEDRDPSALCRQRPGLPRPVRGHPAAPRRRRREGLGCR